MSISRELPLYMEKQKRLLLLGDRNKSTWRAEKQFERDNSMEEMVTFNKSWSGTILISSEEKETRQAQHVGWPCLLKKPGEGDREETRGRRGRRRKQETTH